MQPTDKKWSVCSSSTPNDKLQRGSAVRQLPFDPALCWVFFCTVAKRPYCIVLFLPYNLHKAHSNVTLAAADADDWLAQPASNGPDFWLTSALTLFNQPSRYPNERFSL